MNHNPEWKYPSQQVDNYLIKELLSQTYQKDIQRHQAIKRYQSEKAITPPSSPQGHLQLKQQAFKKYYTLVSTQQDTLADHYTKTIGQQLKQKQQNQFIKNQSQRRAFNQYLQNKSKQEIIQKITQKRMLKDALEKQIQESKAIKNNYRKQQKKLYYDQTHLYNPISNPIPHKVDIYNKYVLNQMLRFKLNKK